MRKQNRGNENGQKRDAQLSELRRGGGCLRQRFSRLVDAHPHGHSLGSKEVYVIAGSSAEQPSHFLSSRGLFRGSVAVDAFSVTIALFIDFVAV